MAPSPHAAFQLRKWYLDCVADDGAAAVVYWARLRWGPLRLRYAALLDAPAPEAPVGMAVRSSGDPAAGVPAWPRPRQSHTLRPDGPPRIDGDRVSWRCGRLGTQGAWRARTGPASRILLRSAAGGIRWRCVQPAADTHLGLERDGGSRTLDGAGYVEELTLTLPPWQLPFRRLWWGRFVAPATALVWIRWEGDSNRGLTLLDGAPHPRPRIRARTVAVPNVMELTYLDTRPLRAGSLAESALRGLPGLVNRLPFAFLAAHECKQISLAELRRPGRDPVRGWAIHEVVSW